jgi:DNA (cytosine-5)-methyltransferase 1
MLGAVRAIAPRAVFIENVAGLTEGSRRLYYIELISQLQRYGYIVSSWVLDAADYGVPQHRRRLFVIAVRGSSVGAPPRVTRPWRTSGAALDGVGPDSPNLSPVIYAKRPHIRVSPYTGLLFNGSGRPVDPSAPAPTILAIAGGNKTHFLDTTGHAVRYHHHLARGGMPRSGHVPGARRLTVAQSAALQDLPSSTTWHGGRTSQYRQIGNAVPPSLAAAAALQVAAALRRGKLDVAA